MFDAIVVGCLGTRGAWATPRRFAAVLLLVVLWPILVASPVSAAEPGNASSDSPVAFVSDHPLDIELADPTSGTTAGEFSVAIRNDTSEAVTPVFVLVLDKVAPDAITVAPKDPAQTIPPSSARWVNLTVSKQAATGPAKGYLALSGGSGRPSLVAIVISPPAAGPSSIPFYIVVTALVSGLIVAVALAARHYKELGGKVGPVKFFDPSPGSLLAIGGGIAGAVVGLLPEETTLVPRDTLVGLAALFAVIYVLGPLAYRALGNLEQNGHDLQETGTVRLFIGVVVVFVAAIVGQLLTVLVLFGDALVGGASFGLIGAAGAMALVAAALIALYGVRWASATIEHRDKSPGKQHGRTFASTRETNLRRPWTPL
ncbi:MAG: hypothetical protein M3N29_08310 [Chloroflexota bacterium]|nr:hypothetical protein [Chloroflexota bacterium]